MKVVVQFKGREMQHKELGRDLLQKIYQPIEDIAAMESPPKVSFANPKYSYHKSFVSYSLCISFSPMEIKERGNPPLNVLFLIIFFSFAHSTSTVS